MADFEYAFASSGTPTSFPITGTSITGIDESGLLTPKIIGLGPSVTILMTATQTDAQVAALMQAWLNRQGYSTNGAAGGFVAQTTVQIAPTETSVSAAD